VSVLLNAGGGFAPPVLYATDSSPGPVTSGDFNGDGRQDLAVLCSGSNKVDVLLNIGSNYLSASVTTPSLPQAGAVAINYVLASGKSTLCTIAVQYCSDGGNTWIPATPSMALWTNKTARTSSPTWAAPMPSGSWAT
jgi:hypothetical protein